MKSLNLNFKTKAFSILGVIVIGLSVIFISTYKSIHMEPVEIFSADEFDTLLDNNFSLQKAEIVQKSVKKIMTSENNEKILHVELLTTDSSNEDISKNLFSAQQKIIELYSSDVDEIDIFVFKNQSDYTSNNFYKKAVYVSSNSSNIFTEKCEFDSSVINSIDKLTVDDMPTFDILSAERTYSSINIEMLMPFNYSNDCLKYFAYITDSIKKSNRMCTKVKIKSYLSELQNYYWEYNSDEPNTLYYNYKIS